MKTKDGSVNIWGLDLKMQPVLKHADAVWKKHKSELVITSARDGMHSAGSLHYYGFAIDCRIWGLLPEEVKEIIDELESLLGEGYDVVLEGDHIHIEYDKAKIL